jgi:hypothetical protein
VKILRVTLRTHLQGRGISGTIERLKGTQDLPRTWREITARPT